MSTNPWLIQRASSAKVRIYYFPYAGGSAAAFLPWQAALSPSIEICGVQLPGRSARIHEQPCTSWSELITTISAQITNADPRPFAFFGHSLGALIAFEVSRYCARHGHRLPTWLFVSGCASPRNVERQELHLLDDDQLIDALRELNGTPPEILSNRELMDVLLPTIRADLTLSAIYEYRRHPPLDLPITVLVGSRDRDVQPEQASWAGETAHPCEILWFDGGHFFIHEQERAVIHCVKSRLNVPLATV
jgi:surfactin synthase thioesterase subunit